MTNRLKSGAFLMALLISLHISVSLAAPTSSNLVSDIIEIDLKKEKTLKVRLSQPKAVMNEPPTVKAGITTDYTLVPEDAKNLDTLWKTVITRNPVIQYGLKQLATPPELRYAQSSIMSRTLGGLLSGAALLPYMMGADQYTAGATTIGANLVDRAIQQSDKIDPSQLPSDTELVELAGIVQDLQKQLVTHYFQYKSSLITCIQLQEQLISLGARYQHTFLTPDPLDELWLTEQQQTIQNKLLHNRQEAKQHFLILERLVGAEGMRHLQFEENTISASDSGKIETVSETSLSDDKAK